MIVYRVENCNGVGPYQYPGRDNDDAFALHDLIMQEHNYCRCHPGPGREGFALTLDHVFGFTSTASMDKWFEHMGQMLEDCGFSVMEYEVESDFIQHGKAQVTFPRSRGTITKVHKPSQLIS